MSVSPTTLMTAFMLPTLNMMTPLGVATPANRSPWDPRLAYFNPVISFQSPVLTPWGIPNNPSRGLTNLPPSRSTPSTSSTSLQALSPVAGYSNNIRVKNGKVLKAPKPGADPNAEMIDHFRAFEHGAILGAILGIGNQVFLGGASPWGVIKESFGFSPKEDELVVHQCKGIDDHLYRYVTNEKGSVGLPTTVYRTPKKGFFNNISRDFCLHAKIDYHDLDGNLTLVDKLNPFSKGQSSRPSQYYTVRLFEDNGVTLKKIVSVSPQYTQVETFPHGEPLRQTFQKLDNTQGHLLIKTEKKLNDQWHLVEKLEPVWKNGKLMVQEVLEHANPLMHLLGNANKGGIKPALILDHVCHITPNLPRTAKTLFIQPSGQRVLQRILGLRGIWMGAAVGAIATWFVESCNAINTTARFNVTQYPSGLLSGGTPTLSTNA